MHIARDDPGRDDVRELIEAHLAFARSASPPEDVHALSHDQLAELLFFSLRTDRLVAVGALQPLSVDHAELKSMHTAAAFRGRGYGRAMLDHLLQVARDQGFGQVSLETGSMVAFEPARALYVSVGFAECEPFGSYVASPHSVFMSLRLEG